MNKVEKDPKLLGITLNVYENELETVKPLYKLLGKNLDSFGKKFVKLYDKGIPDKSFSEIKLYYSDGYIEIYKYSDLLNLLFTVGKILP